MTLITGQDMRVWWPGRCPARSVMSDLQESGLRPAKPPAAPGPTTVRGDSRHVLGLERVPVRIGAAVTAAVAVAVGTWQTIEAGVVFGIGSGVAILIAGAVFGLAVSLRGISPEGLLLGVGIPIAAMMTWTHLYKPIYVWTCEAILCLVCALWTFPWWKEWREILKLGAFWISVPIWFYSLLALAYVAFWEPHRSMTVAGQRLVYGAYALLVTLLAYQAIRRRMRDISIGFAAGLLICQSALLVAGCQYVFISGYHYTSQTAWGSNMTNRFWGGPWLVYHPNYIAMTVVIAALRIVPDPKFKVWQRVGTLATMALMLILTQSRTSFGIAGVGFAVYALIYIRRHGLPRWRFWSWLSSRDWQKITLKALVPGLVTILAFGLAGGPDLLFTARYQKPTNGGKPPPGQVSVNGMTSGRLEVVGRILKDYRKASVPEKLFGDGDNSRGYITRTNNPRDPNYKTQPKWTADNGPIGMLRRGGAVGFVSFFVSAGLILWRTLRGRPPIWMPAAVIGVFACSMTEDEVTGTTPAWLILLAAEAWMYTRRYRQRAEGDGEAPDPVEATPRSPAPAGS